MCGTLSNLSKFAGGIQILLYFRCGKIVMLNIHLKKEENTPRENENTCLSETIDAELICLD